MSKGLHGGLRAGTSSPVSARNFPGGIPTLPALASNRGTVIIPSYWRKTSPLQGSCFASRGKAGLKLKASILAEISSVKAAIAISFNTIIIAHNIGRPETPEKSAGFGNKTCRQIMTLHPPVIKL